MTVNIDKVAIGEIELAERECFDNTNQLIACLTCCIVASTETEDLRTSDEKNKPQRHRVHGEIRDWESFWVSFERRTCG